MKTYLPTKINSLIKKFKNLKKTGRKRRFLLYGVLNVSITNLVLQGLIILMPSYLATLFSQIVNLSLGCYTYGKKVFKVTTYRKGTITRYIFLALIIWNLNWILIEAIKNFGPSRNLSALILMPFLAGFSYFMQKKYVFL